MTSGQPNPTIDDVLRREPADTYAYLAGKAVPESDAFVPGRSRAVVGELLHGCLID